MKKEERQRWKKEGKEGRNWSAKTKRELYLAIQIYKTSLVTGYCEVY